MAVLKGDQVLNTFSTCKATAPSKASIPQPLDFHLHWNHPSIPINYIYYVLYVKVKQCVISVTSKSCSTTRFCHLVFFSGNPIFLSTVVTLPCLDLLNTDTSSASEDEGSLRRQGRLATSTPYQGHGHPAVEHWFNRVIQGSSTSSSASSTSSHPGGRSVTTTAHAALNANAAATALADLMAHTQLGQWPMQSHTPSHFRWPICMFFFPPLKSMQRPHSVRSRTFFPT